MNGVLTLFLLAESTQVKWYKCLRLQPVAKESESQIANKQGRRPKKRITGSSSVYPILGFMTFRECCVFGFLLF